MYSSLVNKKTLRGPSGRKTAEHGDANVMLSLLRAGQAVERQLEEALEAVGLSLPKFGVLTHLVRSGGPLSLSECAARMTCVRSNITQLVDRLEAEGLVRRVDDPNDRRGVLAIATPLGVERQAAGAQRLEQAQREFSRTLSSADRAALARALANVR